MLTNSVSPYSGLNPLCPQRRGGWQCQLPSGANGLQARQEAQDFQRGVRAHYIQIHFDSLRTFYNYRGLKVQMTASLSSTAAGLLHPFTAFFAGSVSRESLPSAWYRLRR